LNQPAVTTPPDFDPGRFEVLTFDCYGTLIDWETGIIDASRAAFGRAGADGLFLEAFARHEARLEAGEYRPYRQILGEVLDALGREVGVAPTAEQRSRFAASVGDWPPFADSPPALRRLATRYRLGVVTNCDDDLFERSQARLGIEFTWVVTAQQVRSYKPSHRNFEVAIERIGLQRARILHVAQSLYHDHVPAKELGLTTAWIDRRHGREGGGATPPATAAPDIIAVDLATFASVMGC
jgi:2-haloacid dehalogenase